MSLALVRAVAQAELADDLHLARVMLLLHALAGRKLKAVDGLTRFVKLDFFLRYPNCLLRVLQNVGVPPNDAGFAEYELDTIESKMIRFRFGPWDPRYRRWIYLLRARGLVTLSAHGRTVSVHVTGAGARLAENLGNAESFAEIKKRSRLIAKHFGPLSGAAIDQLVARAVPELATMRWGQEIEL